MKLDEISLKQLFSAYANRLGDMKVQYLCEKCHQQFSANWTIRATPFNPYAARGSYVLCPYCGERHDRYVQYVDRDEAVPYEIRLKTCAYKTKVVLTAHYRALAFSGLYEYRLTAGKEVFTFDVKEGRATFEKTMERQNRKPVRLILPVTPLLTDEIISNSVLRFVNGASLLNRLARPALTRLLKNFRNAFVRLLETKLNRKVASAYVNASGADSGMAVLPLLNLANRLLNPDAANLSGWYCVKERAVLPLTPERSDEGDWMLPYIAAVEGGTDRFTALINAFGLPNLTVVRKLLRENVDSIVFLQSGFDLFADENLAVRFALAFQAYAGAEVRDDRGVPEALAFVKELLAAYKAHDVVSLMEKAKIYRLRDCQRLYGYLSEDNKAKLNTSRIRLRDLHDWLAMEHKKQTHVNVPLGVPEHVVKRLSMQADRLSFFLPQQSLELLKAGHVLHNCVASYEEAVKQGKTWIVVVADDKGRYMACLRVEQGRLVEAKITGNDPVSDNREVNRAVIEWTKESKVKIATKDVNTEEVGKSQHIA